MQLDRLGFRGITPANRRFAANAMRSFGYLRSAIRPSNGSAPNESSGKSIAMFVQEGAERKQDGSTYRYSKNVRSLAVHFETVSVTPGLSA